MLKTEPGSRSLVAFNRVIRVRFTKVTMAVALIRVSMINSVTRAFRNARLVRVI
jgi:hypothetical protein